MCVYIYTYYFLYTGIFLHNKLNIEFINSKINLLK